MTNTDDLELWLAENGIPLEKYSTVLQGGTQFIMGQSSMIDFKKAVLDWDATYSSEVVSKTTAGINKFSYLILGSNKGFMVTIDNSAAAPGVVVNNGGDNMAWMTETRKNIIINAVVFGAIAGISALGKAFVDNQPLDFPMVQAVMGAVLTALLLYLQSKSQQLETGARKPTKKSGVKFGI